MFQQFSKVCISDTEIIDAVHTHVHVADAKKINLMISGEPCRHVCCICIVECSRMIMID